MLEVLSAGRVLACLQSSQQVEFSLVFSPLSRSLISWNYSQEKAQRCTLLYVISDLFSEDDNAAHAVTLLLMLVLCKI